MFIAVCDDDAADGQQIQQMVMAYAKAHSVDVRCAVYASARALMDAFDRGHAFAGFLLDVAMPDTDGIALGESIRKLWPDVPIAYITSSREYALDAYRVKAARYLVKPVKAEELSEALDYFGRMLVRQEPQCFNLRTQTGMEQLDIARILYVESALHTVAVAMADEDEPRRSVNYRRSFGEIVAPLMERAGFLRVHKSFVVNLNQVKWYTSDSFTMTDGQVIPISQKFRKDVRQAYLTYFEADGQL